MSKKMLFAAPLVSLLMPTAALASDGIECHPDSKKLEWYVCVLKEVEYKRGMKTEKRTECAVNQKLDVKGCNLGELMSYLPEGEDPEQMRVYAIGPADFDDTAWESQENHDANTCKVNVTTLESYHLTKFSDAFDKSNSERGRDFDAALKAKNRMVLPNATFSPFKWPGADCAGKSSRAGKLDKKTVSKFLYYVETSFK